MGKDENQAMKGNLRRFLSLTLVLSMVLTMFTPAAFADEVEHVFGEPVITAATCTEAGNISITCADCGATVEEEIPASGHAFGEYVYNDDATEEADGTKTATCATCGVTDTVTAEGTMIVVEADPSEAPAEEPVVEETTEEDETTEEGETEQPSAEATEEPAEIPTVTVAEYKHGLVEVGEYVDGKVVITATPDANYFAKLSVGGEEIEGVYGEAGVMTCELAVAEDVTVVADFYQVFKAVELAEDAEDREVEYNFAQELDEEALEELYTAIFEACVLVPNPVGVTVDDIDDLEITYRAEKKSSNTDEEAPEELWVLLNEEVEGYETFNLTENGKDQIKIGYIGNNSKYLNAALALTVKFVVPQPEEPAIEDMPIVEDEPIVEEETVVEEEPEELLHIGKVGAAAETYAAAADAGWYWNSEKTILYIKDGSYTQANFHAALLQKFNISSATTVAYDDAAHSYNWTIGVTYLNSSSNTAVNLTHNKTYYATYNNDPRNQVSFIVYHYFTPTVEITGITGQNGTVSPSDSTKDIILSGTNNTVVTVPHVDGYNVSATYNGINVVMTKNGDNWSGTFTAVNSTAVTVTYTLAAVKPASITIESAAGNGSGTINFGGLTANGNLTAGTYALTVTPSDINGADGSAMYVEKVEVNGTALTGSYNGGVYTASYTVENNTDYTIKVTYGTVTLTNQGGTLELNGYGSDMRWDNLKAKVLNATLGGYQNIDEYTVYVWGDFVGDPTYRDATDKPLTTEYKSRLKVPAYGATGSQKVKIVKAASSDGKIVALTLTDATIPTKESRELASVYFGNAVSGKYDTEALFKEAVAGTINVRDNNNADCKANAGLTITLNPVEGKDNTYTVSYSLANDGATWLKTSGTLPGEVVWNISVYKVTFVNEDTTVLSEDEYPYGTTADEIVTPTATKAAKVDEAGNVMATYTFAGWDPAVETVTKAVTYTATYTEVAETYTITWVNGDETTTTTVAYGETPVAPEASKTSTAQYHFTNGTWGTIDTVTGDATYTATFTEELRSYTITWVNGDTTTTTTVAYGETPVAPAATKSDKKDDAGNVMETYTNGTWGTIAAVTGEATYTATFTEVPAEYTVTWDIYGENDSSADYVYGTLITDINVPENPSDYVIDGTNWEFNKWVYPENVEKIVSNITITAEYKIGGNVAKIVRADGEVYFATLQLAVKAAQDGETVILLEDIELTTRFIFSVYVTGGKNVTVDGDGHKLYASTTAWTTNNGKHLINVNVDNITLKNIVLDCKKTAEGVNVYMAQNIIFDNVTVANNKGYNAALTVNRSILTLKTRFTTIGVSTYDIDVDKSEAEYPLGLVAEAGTVLDIERKNIQLKSAAYPNSDLDEAMSTDGTSFYTFKKLDSKGVLAGYTNSLSTINNGCGVKVLEDTTISSNVTLVNANYTGTLNLNGRTLTAAGNTLTVNGNLIITGGNKITGLALGSEAANITADAGINVANSLDKYDVQYEEGKYFLGSLITFEYGNGEEKVVGCVPAPRTFNINDPTWDGHLFAGWDPALVIPPVGNATYTAKWNDDADIDGEIDGSEADPYWTIKIENADGTFTTHDNILNGEYYATPAAIDKAYAIFVEWTRTVEDTTVTFTAVWNTNDTNDNNVDDASETGTVTLVQEGNGNVTLTPAGNATLVKQEGNAYTYLYDSTDAANKVINVTTSLIDTNATDGNVDYLISAPATVNVGETLTVKFGTVLLNATNGIVGINKYYTSKSNKSAIATLRTDILKAAGLDPNGSYVVTAVVGIESLGSWATWTVEVKDGDASVVRGNSDLYNQGYLAGELNKASYSFVITQPANGNVPAVSKTVTMKMVDSRSSAGLVDTEITDVKVLDDQQGLNDYVNGLANGSGVNPNGVTVTVTLTEGSWPPAAAGVTTKLVYTVKYADSADYIGDEAKLKCNMEPEAAIVSYEAMSGKKWEGR